MLRELKTVLPTDRARIRVDGREYINFSSNDYLGLAAHPELARAARKALTPVVGSSAARLMTGSTPPYHLLEEKVSHFKRKPAALVYNSGYQANVGIISALCGKDDAIFSDRLNHASIVDGIRLSGAKCFRFRHNDAEHLEELLSRHRTGFREVLIVTETVFSMDGDIAPVEKLVRLKEKYDCLLMVDEAHATGIFGKDGSGITGDAGMARGVDIIMGTFSKALGGFGSYVATSAAIRDYLINTSRSFIYSTALPPAVIAAGIASLDIVAGEPHRRETLLANADHFRNRLKEAGFCVKGDSQIVPVIVGDSGETVRLSESLKDKGYWVTPVRPPTVPQGQARLRMSLTFNHTRDDLDRFVEAIKQERT